MFHEPFMLVTEVDELTGEHFELEYYLLEEPIAISESIETITYGVAVQMNRRGKSEIAKADSLCTTRAEAEEFAKRLARGSVTPATFLDIVDDSFSPPVRREAWQTV